MRAKEELFMRRLSLTLTTIVLLVSVATIYGLQWLPSEPLHLRRNFTLYSVFVLIVSGAGFVGAVKRNGNLLNLFASHLLLDSILYLIPRILIINFSISLPSVLCAAAPPSTRNDDAYRVYANPRLAAHFLESDRCRTLTWALEACVVSGMVLVFGLQVWLALKIRRYAQYLEKMEIQAERAGQMRQREKEMC